MVHVVNKGKAGEREAIKFLLPLVDKALELEQRAPHERTDFLAAIQRNQNQSAVGGKDLVGLFGLSFEVKRQEVLSIGRWWEQCCAGAQRNGEDPVLMFRQNRRPWRFVLYGAFPVDAQNGRLSSAMIVPAELSADAFSNWFVQWVRFKVRQGYRPQI